MLKENLQQEDMNALKLFKTMFEVEKHNITVVYYNAYTTRRFHLLIFNFLILKLKNGME